ncbi:MAG: NfeD family protein [Bacilli bacterium]
MHASVWLFIIGVLLVLVDFAAGTLSLLFIGISLIATFFVYFLTESVFITFVTFIVLSLVSFVAASMLRKKSRTESIESGVYRLVGKAFPIYEVNDSDPFTGTIRVNGEVWNVMSNIPLEEEMRVVIESVSGATFYVKKVEERKEA